MEKNKILDYFGSLIAKEVFDSQFRFILNDLDDLSQTEGYKSLFKGMNSEQKGR